MSKTENKKQFEMSNLLTIVMWSLIIIGFGLMSLTIAKSINDTLILIWAITSFLIGIISIFYVIFRKNNQIENKNNKNNNF